MVATQGSCPELAATCTDTRWPPQLFISCVRQGYNKKKYSENTIERDNTGADREQSKHTPAILLFIGSRLIGPAARYSTGNRDASPDSISTQAF